MKSLTAAAILIITIGILPIASCTKPSGTQTVPRMTVEHLKTDLGNPNLVIIDVRTGPDWKNSHAKIKGAVHENPFRIGAWIDKYPKDKTIVIYCT
jgi:rhodanese-related sulfurtransferase